MKNKKNRIILYSIISVFLIGIFVFNNQDKKSEKVKLSPSEKSWLKENKNEKIPILIPQAGSLYLYKAPEGEIKGVYHEYIEWLEKKYGLKFDLIQDSSASQRINSGDAILAYNANKSYNREINYNYLTLEAKTSIVVVKKLGRDFSEENSSVKKLGIVTNTSEANIYLFKYSSYQHRKIMVSSYKEGIEKLKSGEIDLLLGKSKDLLYVGSEVSFIDKISDLNYTLAVNKKYPDLATFLQKTLTVFHKNKFLESSNKHQTLYGQQMLKDDPILREVRQKYKEITVELLDVEDSLPLYYIKDDKFYGYIPTLLENLSNRIEIPVRMVKSSSPEKKHIRALDNDRDSQLSIPYYNWDITVAGKVGAKYVKNYNDLTEKNVGFVNNKYTENFNINENINFIPYPDLENAINALRRNEIDYVMGDFIFLDSKIANLYLDEEIKILGFLEKSKHSLSFNFDEEDRILYTLFLEVFPKDIYEYNQLKELLVSHKITKINYSHLGSMAAFFITIIGVILLFLKKNLDYTKKAEKLNKAMISSFEIASSFNDEDTGQHIVRVAKYSELLAKEIGLSSGQVKDIFHYASLHDIGKIGIPSSILRKPGKLTQEEMIEMRKHPNIGYKLVKNAELGKIAENLVRFHHEKWDGTGYPLGLKGNKIPIEARIVSVADVYDALRQKRTYKSPYTHEEAVQIITTDSETFFDPELIKVFLKFNNKFDEIFNSY
ncbi:MAG: HD domain-containing phosphohydrolase [Fusobacteriaceae bacterium]